MEELREQAEEFTVAELHGIRQCLGFDFPGGKKKAFVTALLGFLSSLEDQESFQEWFHALPSYLARAIEEAAFAGYVDSRMVEELAGKPVVSDHHLNRYYYYYEYPPTNSDLRLGIFRVYINYNRKLLLMNDFFRMIFSRLFPHPPGYTAVPCEEPSGKVWSAVEALSESMSLLFKGMDPYFEEWERHKALLSRRLPKGDIKELRKTSAFPPFPSGQFDPIELLVRFFLSNPKLWESGKTRDVRDFIKETVIGFFVVPESGMMVNYYHNNNTSFEYAVLCSHLKKGPGPRLDRDSFDPYPRSRELFYQVLIQLGKSGKWFEADQTAETLRLQALPFTFFNHVNDANFLLLKGDELSLPEGTIKVEPWEKGFIPDPYLRHLLLIKPLFKGYCYLMAALGILEIEEGESPRILKKKGKLLPLSPWEGLRRIRITPFGSWCLGLSEVKPPLREVRYEAIADRELPLVTYRGHSLECQVFLERIGEPVGEDRFRISEASFIRDCASLEDIEGRIADFCRLIVKEPPSHWEALFDRIRDRASLFDDEEPCRMIQLPDDRELRRLFLEEKKLASLVVRAEGGRIVVKEGDYKKLRRLLEGYGVLKG